MKKHLLSALLALAAFPSLVCAQAEAGPNSHPAMWVVKDADTTIYLFGSAHVLDEKSDWFHGEIKAAFDASEEIYLEALVSEDLAVLQPLLLKYAVDPGGRTLSNRLSAEVKAKLDRLLSAGGIPKGAFDGMEPWFVDVTVTALAGMKAGITTENGTEKSFVAAARNRGIEVRELESMEFQFAMLDKLPEEDQLTDLIKSVEKFEEVGRKLKRMIAAWATGDIEGLARFVHEEMADHPAVYKAMFSDRNATWVKWIQKRLDTPGKVFVAVGVGHLVGKESVPQLLEAQGLKAERVK